MLRRKLLIILSPLVALLAITAVAAVWSLQKLLTDLDHVNTHAWHLVEQVNALSMHANTIELELHRLHAGDERHLDRLIESVNAAHAQAQQIGENYVLQNPQVEARLASVQQHLPELQRHVGALATTEDADLRRLRMRQFLEAGIRISRDTVPLSRFAREHAKVEQDALLRRFRHVVLALTLMFLIVINISVIILMRMAGVILRPMAKLTEATRQLGNGDFSYRVSLPERDEFGQLGTAFNDLAQRLSEDEQRKMEVLQQTARTLNHELNNCISIIEMQLQLLQRRSGERAEMESRLRQIRGSMQRMTSTVEALLHVRRIVLTDYTPGIKMLDLEKSVRNEESGDTACPNPDATDAKPLHMQ